MPGHRPAPLHTAPPPGARPRRRRAADGTSRLLAWPPPLGVPPGVGDIARGGLGRESQAGTTALARGGAGRPGEATQAPAPGGLGSARQAAACRAAEPRLGVGLPVRPDRGRAGPEAAQHRRRAHAGGAGDRGRQEHQRRRHGLNARGDRRPARGYIRCDNSPELTPNALRDWCRFSGTGSSYIEPGAPWENPYVESFNGRLRDEFLAVEQFDSLLEAQVLIEDWRIEYNTKRPNSSLGWLAPSCLRRALGGSATRWTLISGGLAKGVRSILADIAEALRWDEPRQSPGPHREPEVE